MDIEYTRKVCKRLGVKFAEKNHRIYNDPPVIKFVHPRSFQSSETAKEKNEKS